jgi:hypothetical protein
LALPPDLSAKFTCSKHTYSTVFAIFHPHSRFLFTSILYCLQAVQKHTDGIFSRQPDEKYKAEKNRAGSGGKQNEKSRLFMKLNFAGQRRKQNCFIIYLENLLRLRSFSNSPRRILPPSGRQALFRLTLQVPTI